MKVYDLKYAGGIRLGILLVPKAIEEDSRTQQWFQEFNLPPVSAEELNPNKVILGKKTLQEWEDEYYGSTEEDQMCWYCDHGHHGKCKFFAKPRRDSNGECCRFTSTGGNG